MRLPCQIDVVVEYPFAPSITLTDDARLYFAESVAAVIEVKSDVAGQWKEVERSAAALHAIQRKYTGGMAHFGGINEGVIRGTIPMLAVGYTGWAQPQTAAQHMQAAGVDGVLVIDKGIFVSSQRLKGITANGPLALWGMICALHEATEAIGATRLDLLSYAK
jgi:hypothetical protein